MARKQWWRLGVVALGAALITACADQEPISPLAPRDISGAKSTTQTTSYQLGDSLFAEFTVYPAGGTYNIVGRKLRMDFPTNSICDLETSSYGPGTWDDACVPETQPVHITAKLWLDADSHPHVDFQPAMRFSPTLTSGVVLYLKDRNAQYRDDMTMLYCVTDNGCRDESLTDPSLVTMVDSDNALVYRRIKHFSGYNVTAGRTTDTVDATVDATLTETLP